MMAAFARLSLLFFAFFLSSSVVKASSDDGADYLEFEDFYSENPDELSTFEKWKPAIDLLAMAVKKLNGQDAEPADEQVPTSRRGRDFDDDLDGTSNDTADEQTTDFGQVLGRCPPPSPLLASSRDRTSGGRREGRQLLPGLFFDETSEHPFIILLQYVVPLVSVDLPVLLPPNLRNIDRSKPTLAGAFQAIP